MHVLFRPGQRVPHGRGVASAGTGHCLLRPHLHDRVHKGGASEGRAVQHDPGGAVQAVPAVLAVRACPCTASVVSTAASLMEEDSMKCLVFGPYQQVS